MKNKQAFQQFLAPTSPYPIQLEVSKAEGSYVYDEQGKAYLDFVGGIAVNNTGHRHAHVVQAIEQQLKRYLHVMPYGEYVFDVQTKLAEKLVKLLPKGMEQVYFVNSGTEAVEAACKLAKRYTGRGKIAAFKRAYHGSTQGALSLSSYAHKKQAFQPLIPGVVHLEFNKLEDLDLIDESLAAIVVEPIQGDAGVRTPSVEFMQALGQRCAQRGTVLIFDEVQTGMGRTGTWFAAEHFGVKPDIIVMGKALGAGLPLAAFAGSAEIMQSFKEKPVLGHITTFGGNPLACAAALAGIEVLEDDIIAQVQEKADLLASLLSSTEIIDLRYKGLMFAVELNSAETVQHVISYCRSKGLLSFFFLSAPNCFRLQPPLTVSKEEIKQAAAIINEALDSAATLA